MTTLKKYFKNHDFISNGSFIVNQIDGRLYVLSVDCRSWIKVVDIVSGESIRANVEDETRPTAGDIRTLFFTFEEAPDKLLTKLHKLSNQEAIGKFASLVL